MSKLDYVDSFAHQNVFDHIDIEMDEVQYPLPKLNPEQEMTIERIMADLLHSSEQAPASSPGSLGPDSPSSSLDSPLHNETSMTNDIVYEFMEHMEKDHEESTSRKDEAKILSKCDYIKSEIRRSCSCQFYFLAENEQDMWNDRGHLTIHLNNDTAIYKETTGPAASDIGVIVISDTMGSELRGSRQAMELLTEKGFNVIKPMLYETSQIDFLQLLVNVHAQGNDAKKTPDVSVPAVIKNAQSFLMKQGCKYISVVGICWGGLIAQKILSTDETFTTVIAVDGLYYDPDFSAKSPALFLMGNEPARVDVLDAMEQVMWSNNIVPWDMQRLLNPFGHGFMMSCLAGCTKLNPEIRDLIEETPGCKIKFRAMMSESRLKVEQIAGFIEKFSNSM